MSNAVYVSRLRLVQEKWPLRRAYLRDVPDPIEIGSHRGIRSIYKAEPERPVPSAFDYAVSAVAG